MDWSAVAKQLVALGLPVLGGALLGPLGGTAAGFLVKALGLGDGATPGQVSTELARGDIDVKLQQLKSAEAQYTAAIKAEAEVAGIQIKSVNETMRAEYSAAMALPGFLGKFILFLQLSWRPLFAYQALFQMGGIGLVLFHEVWTGDFATLKALVELEPFLRWYIGVQAAFLGVYSWGRTKEKIEAQQAPTTGLIDQIAKVMARKSP